GVHPRSLLRLRTNPRVPTNGNLTRTVRIAMDSPILALDYGKFNSVTCREMGNPTRHPRKGLPRTTARSEGGTSSVCPRVQYEIVAYCYRDQRVIVLRGGLGAHHRRRPMTSPIRPVAMLKNRRPPLTPRAAESNFTDAPS